jgi:SAM-dependent methyltransferase
MIGSIIFRLSLLRLKLLSRIRNVATGRVVEYPWLLKNLEIENGRVLDVGCCYSYLSHELLRRGYAVYGVDVDPYPQRHPKLKFYQIDIRNSPFPNNFFDLIIAVSTIEHIGLGFSFESLQPFQEKMDLKGDRKAIEEMIRILKPNGKILLTLPFGEQGVTESERTYDYPHIKELLNGLNIEQMTFYVKKGGNWIQTSFKSGKIDLARDGKAIVCIKALKNEGPQFSIKHKQSSAKSH